MTSGMRNVWGWRGTCPSNYYLPTRHLNNASLRPQNTSRCGNCVTQTYIHTYSSICSAVHVTSVGQHTYLFEAVNMSDHRHRLIIPAAHKMQSQNSISFLTTVRCSFAYRAQLSMSHYFSLKTDTDPLP
jgi:hypothetical protein